MGEQKVQIRHPWAFARAKLVGNRGKYGDFTESQKWHLFGGGVGGVTGQLLPLEASYSPRH